MKVIDQPNISTYKEISDMIAELPFLGGNDFVSYILESELFSVCEYDPGEKIFSKDSFSKSLSILVEGKAVAKKTHGGKDLVIRSFQKGDLFGVAALFSEENEYVSEICADTKCVIAFIPQEIVNDIFQQSPHAAIAYISLLSQKIRYLNAKLDNISAPTALSKLCYYLLDSGDVRLSMQSLAQALGISRMSLYRCLDVLVQNGWLKKEGKSLVILDREALARIATSEEIF